MEIPSPNEIRIEFYCRLVAFFALDSDEQRALIPEVTEPIYASFNEGDGTYTRPLEILFLNLRDAVAHIAIHRGESEYSFVPQRLNDALSEAVRVLEWKWLSDDFDFSIMDTPDFQAVRQAAREVWNALGEEHHLPLGDWRDFTG